MEVEEPHMPQFSQAKKQDHPMWSDEAPMQQDLAMCSASPSNRNPVLVAKQYCPLCYKCFTSQIQMQQFGDPQLLSCYQKEMKEAQVL